MNDETRERFDLLVQTMREESDPDQVAADLVTLIDAVEQLQRRRRHLEQLMAAEKLSDKERREIRAQMWGAVPELLAQLKRAL